MSNRNKIAYIKPNEPSFIRKLKQEANYKEGPNIDTKVRYHTIIFSDILINFCDLFFRIQ